MAWTERNPSLQDDRYLDEATALWSLLSDGAPELGYHVQRTRAVRDAQTKAPLPASYTREWRPARERHADGTETDRRLNSYVLQKHILGHYDVAWESPSWTSLVVLDIDRPKVIYKRGERVDPSRELAANYARDAMLAAVWRAFGCDQTKQPVVLRTPGAGYHVYLPLSRGDGARERTWPAAWAREHIEHHLNRHGLELRPGKLELFPAGTRLRAPCGARMALMEPTCPDDPDDLRLALVHAQWQPRNDGAVLVRDIGATVRGFLGAIEASRLPLDSWMDQPAPCWGTTWGPFGERKQADAEKKHTSAPRGVTTRSQHKEELLRGSGSPAGALTGEVTGSGWLLYGAEFLAHVRQLTETGLLSPGQRHDGALKLTWYWACCQGLDRAQTLARVREWLEQFEHVSATRQANPARFLKLTMREVTHYYDRHVAQRAAGVVSASGIDLALRPLPDVDRQAILAKVDREVQSEVVTLLRYLRGAASADGRVPHPVNLAHGIRDTLCGDRRVRVVAENGHVRRRRATVIAMEELTRLGVLTLHTDYSTGNHGRLHSCWYHFGTGVLPEVNEAGELVLASRMVEEGQICAVSDDGGNLRVELAETVPSNRELFEGVGVREPWWVRMYQRRAFTPVEFFAGDHRKLIPGPFRHRFPRAEVQSWNE